MSTEFVSLCSTAREAWFNIHAEFIKMETKVSSYIKYRLNMCISFLWYNKYALLNIVSNNQICQGFIFPLTFFHLFNVRVLVMKIGRGFMIYYLLPQIQIATRFKDTVSLMEKNSIVKVKLEI